MQKLCAALRILTLGLIAGVLAGCITETQGGMPGPADAEARVNAQLDLARGYLEQRDLRRAKQPLARALEIDGRNVEAHVLSGVLYAQEGEAALAESHYKKALQYDPSYPLALNNYASFLYANERYKEALVPLSKLVQDTSYRARALAFESLGLTHLQLQDTQQAQQAFSRALQLNNRLPRSNLELADIALREDQMDVAQTHFNFFNRLAKPNARSLCLGLRLGVARNDAEQVARYQLALKNLFPDTADQCQIRG